MVRWSFAIGPFSVPSYLSAVVVSRPFRLIFGADDTNLALLLFVHT